MRISKVRATPLFVPFRKFYGRHIKAAQGDFIVTRYALVEVETDEGVTGIGEICSVFQRHGEVYAYEVNDILAPALKGLDARDVTAAAAIMDALLDRSEPAKAGVEMALVDALGKSLGMPAYRLLGGKRREKIPLSFSVMYGAPDEMGALASELVAEGFRTLKVKAGQSMETDIAAVKAVREGAGPDIKVRVDANACWPQLKTALAHIRAMEAYDVELYEQPLPAESLADLRLLRSLVNVPIMVDESVWSPADAFRVITAGAADVLNVYVSEAGGLMKARQIFEMAELAGVGCTIGSMPELGIGTAAQIHLGIAAPRISHASDVCGVKYFEHDVIREKLPIRDGFAHAIEAPGLGVTLDPDAVREYTKRPRHLESR